MKAIKKAVNGTTTKKTTLDPKSRELIIKEFGDLKKKKDSLFEASAKLEVEKDLKNAAYENQQSSLKNKFNEAAKNRNAKLPRQKNGGSVKAKDGKWMQKAAASIKRRGTEGKCTPITKPGCTGKAKALAKTFKKIAKSNKKK